MLLFAKATYTRYITTLLASNFDVIQCNISVKFSAVHSSELVVWKCKAAGMIFTEQLKKLPSKTNLATPIHQGFF